MQFKPLLITSLLLVKPSLTVSTKNVPYSLAVDDSFNSSTIPNLNPTDFHLEMYLKQFMTSLYTAAQTGFPMDVLYRAVPHVPLKQVLEAFEFQIGTLTNFNSEFDSVDGISSDKIRWLVQANDRKPSDPVLLYFHGGGYAYGAIPIFPVSLFGLYEQLENDRLSILMVDYNLSYEENGKYPGQLIQGVNSYNKLTESCENIYLLGDAAGGHLSLGMLRSIKHPVPGVPEMVSKPNGTIVVSPWTRLYPEEKGYYVDNFSKDVLTAKGIKELAELFVSDPSQLNSPELNPSLDKEVDWKDILPPMDKFLTTVAELEVSRGDIEDWFDLAEIPESSRFFDARFYHDSLAFYPIHSNAVVAIVDFLKRNL